ncbi:MAG: hypothetical protein E7460_02835 [Ruminococcaceae bacterium]|nr:hypothetical protein [Oscillospiraceae bacterium]
MNQKLKTALLVIAAFVTLGVLAFFAYKPLTSGFTKHKTYTHWYVATDNPEELFGSEEFSYSATTEDRALYHSIIERLISSPTDSGLESPFAPNTKVRSITLRDSTLHVNFSQEFALMSDLEQTLAKYCLAKTFSVFGDVSRFQLSVEGAPLNGMNDSFFSIEDCVSGFDSLYPRTTEIIIYSLSPSQTHLDSRMEQFNWYSHESLPRIVVTRLLTENSGGAFPPGTKLNSIHTTVDTVYIEMSLEFGNVKSDTHGALAMYSLINTVASIPDVTYVVITLNGELSSVGGVPLDTPLLPDMSYLNTKS